MAFNRNIKKCFRTCLAVLFAAIISISPGNSQDNGLFILDMVHHNPGEPLTQTKFSDPEYLKHCGYNSMVVNDFTFAHAALTFDKLDSRIFPKGSKERDWVLAAAEKVRQNIDRAHKAGIKVYYFTDIIVLPKRLVELYHDQVVDENGKISFERPRTVEIHKIMIEELFDTFPGLDGLVIRTGETYLNNVPYHTGNNPITKGIESHIKLINLLREEVCVKRDKKIFYRTWLSAGMHEQPGIYLNVTDRITPHTNLIFSIKHTKGDFHRTLDFNPTLGIGRHPQIVEVQCQREYEGKGAYPNYVAEGVINGFEEYSGNKPQKGLKSVQEMRQTAQFKGIWTWSRGGGWVGPYIANEFWPRLNAFVLSRWAQNTPLTEEEVFNQFMDENGFSKNSRKKFRELCLLSSKAVLRGHNSASIDWDAKWVWWTRDQFLSGTDGAVLQTAFEKLYAASILDAAVKEKYEAVELWKKIEKLSREVKLKSKSDQDYIQVSCTYGLLLHKIIAEGWNIMALGFKGDKTGSYNKTEIAQSLKRYDEAWRSYHYLKNGNASCATLYEPYAFVFRAKGYHQEGGLGKSVDKYRNIILQK
ncbi:hypothetical protein [Desertivirga arenae]|uniref:hypothetical protein n=1 Tax=Desertivirga arenae TaxID=2810309 RepID=UPI001A9583A1|nr:hypothetical protein [Pedobacter sp. SYSU D00823]